MLSQNQSKYLAALAVKKYRQKYRKFVVEGEKMVAELLTSRAFVLSDIYGVERWAEANAALLRPFLDKFNAVTEAELAKISSLSTPNLVLAVVEMPNEIPEPAWASTDLCLFLDGLQDPGNMGTILRIADWFGIQAVFCSPDCVDVYSPKVVQATMGAILRVKTCSVVAWPLLCAGGL